ncbi:hypothetical protein LOK49_LG13G01693 [Camellia lanceoleosa]|uniref:Uncharacterized protein n=1 Tax=Camellia lanceoleosa TaxID=1840588 RepID=A0ACC0FKI9_9ERIC|nr:hypothetical protein LOK49_LG13G01693 [Camellia lanceoleosa]
MASSSDSMDHSFRARVQKIFKYLSSSSSSSLSPPWSLTQARSRKKRRRPSSAKRRRPNPHFFLFDGLACRVVGFAMKGVDQRRPKGPITIFGYCYIVELAHALVDLVDFLVKDTLSKEVLFFGLRPYSNEYKRGISGWNFNLEDVTAQASLIQDEDTPSEQDQGERSITSSGLDV